jgi:hypothetical protein
MGVGRGGDDLLDRDPPRDPVLRDALESGEASAARIDEDGPDADMLATAIVNRARPTLAHLRARAGTNGTWWEWTARWGPAVIPVGIAAGVIGVAAASMLSLPPGDEAPPLRSPLVALATVASPARSDAQLIDSLVGPATHEWLLTAAVQR